MIQEYKRYVVVVPESAGNSNSFDDLEEAENYVKQLLLDTPAVDEVLLYERKKVGMRRSTVEWFEEEEELLEPPNNGGPYQPWTVDQNTYLLSARKAGYSYEQIAEQLGRTPHAVEVQASRLRCG